MPRTVTMKERDEVLRRCNDCFDEGDLLIIRDHVQIVVLGTVILAKIDAQCVAAACVPDIKYQQESANKSRKITCVVRPRDGHERDVMRRINSIRPARRDCDFALRS